MRSKNKSYGYLFLALLFLSGNCWAQRNITKAKNSLSIEKQWNVEPFKLRDINNQEFSLGDFPNAKGFIVIFTCNHCPFANLYTQRINDLNQKYSALNVPLIAINSMDSLIYEEETLVNMKTKSVSNGYNFMYLQDADQQVGKSFGAENTPTAFVIWKDNNTWKIKYKGTIDDNGENPELAKPFISNAVDELLAGKSVSNPQTETFGCRIIYRK